MSNSSVAQLCLTLCDPMSHSMPGLPVHHQLPEFTQTHVRRVDDAFQPSHPLLSPSPPVPNPSQHQSLFQWVSSSLCWHIECSTFTASSFLLKGSVLFLIFWRKAYFWPKALCYKAVEFLGVLKIQSDAWEPSWPWLQAQNICSF